MTSNLLSKDESVWVAGMRIAAWINLISGVIGGFVTAGQVGSMAADRGQDMDWVMFFIVLIAVLILTFLTTAVIMVFLDIARDVSATKRHAADTQRDIAEIKNLLGKGRE